MAILKRQRARKARKIVKRTGIAYGTAVRLAKHIERFSYYCVSTRLCEGAEIVVPTYCDCCGPAYESAKLVGPKGSLDLRDIKIL